MDVYDDLIDFFRDSIELYHGNVEAFYHLDVVDDEELAERLEQYLDHLIYMIKITFKAQHEKGYAEAFHNCRTNQAACVVNDTKKADRFCVIVYHQAVPLSDARFPTLDKAYDEIISLGFTQPTQGAINQHLEQFI